MDGQVEDQLAGFLDVEQLGEQVRRFRHPVVEDPSAQFNALTVGRMPDQPGGCVGAAGAK
nr:hypothetical protein [Arthrobacter sp. JCM 19049]